jgi:hypothetical protein
VGNLAIQFKENPSIQARAPHQSENHTLLRERQSKIRPKIATIRHEPNPESGLSHFHPVSVGLSSC